jgi:hypothetical protein
MKPFILINHMKYFDIMTRIIYASKLIDNAGQKL